MSEREPGAADDERISTRAELLPEEDEAGSEAPHEQAEAILDESDERVDSRAARSEVVERRRSDETAG